ncbi:MAG TPA: HAD family hydrolase [Gemmatales bacterium]|nr:HAD family hydrolase [Gemmatales bacterium]
MKAFLLSLTLLIVTCLASSAAPITPNVADPLPSWNDGPTKQAIIAFVEKVTKEGSPDFVPIPERIATFDNDGTLWCEHPLPVQLYFALDRVKALLPQHPEWAEKEPFASLLKGDLKAALAGGERALVEIIVATHTGMTTSDFEQIVKDWIATAKHPRFNKPYTECVYQPMIELLAYMRANHFKTFIVSGGGIEFMRPWAEKVYGIPPEQVVGSSVKTKFEMRNGKPVLVRLPEMNFIDDKAGKPVGILKHIGRRPYAAFGNSTGDREMLEYTQGGSGARFMLLVFHDDAAREYAYGPAQGMPDTKSGTFTQELYDQAKKDGWSVVSMKKDWNRIFKFDPEVAPTPTSDVTAIDILLLPDETMMKHAQATNDRLRKVFPKGFALDATHHPHITLAQRFVPTENLDKVYTAVGKVFANANLTNLKLEAFKYYYLPFGELGLSGIVIKTTPELLKLEQEVIDAVTPFVVKTGTSAAFVTTPEDPEVLPALIEYVTDFVPKSSGEHYHPHVTTGLASREYLDKMLAEPFEKFTFSPIGAAVYHLGHYGTAAKRLKAFDPKQ